jgi:hypothetical protein
MCAECSRGPSEVVSVKLIGRRCKQRVLPLRAQPRLPTPPHPLPLIERVGRDPEDRPRCLHRAPTPNHLAQATLCIKPSPKSWASLDHRHFQGPSSPIDPLGASRLIQHCTTTRVVDRLAREEERIRERGRSKHDENPNPAWPISPCAAANLPGSLEP